MQTRTKHILGYTGTAIVALIIGTAAGGAGSSSSASPTVTSTVRTTATVTADAPGVAPVEAKTTTIHPPAITKTATKTVHAPAVTKTVKVTPKPKAAIPGDGTYEVGVDIQPGTYVSGVPDSGNCYWARLSGTTGSFGDIIANNNSAGQSVVTIASTDKLFETDGCNDWSRR